MADHDNAAAMARDAITFIEQLGFSKVDLPGFSIGDCVAKQMAVEHGSLVRKLILVGNAPRCSTLAASSLPNVR